MGFFKELFKERITLEIIAGGHILTDKPIPVAIKQAVLMPERQRGKVVISIPFADKKEWFIKKVEWEESYIRNIGTTAAGTIAGGIVGGVGGAIIGAAIGGRRKDKSKAFIVISDIEGNEYELHIHCDQQLYSRLSNLVQ